MTFLSAGLTVLQIQVSNTHGIFTLGEFQGSELLQLFTSNDSQDLVMSFVLFSRFLNMLLC